MGVQMFVGCLLVGFGVPGTIFFMLVAQKAQLTIVTIASAFFWLCAVLFGSIVWTILSPLQHTHWFVIVLNVCIQEITRYFFYKFYVKAENSFSVVSTNAIAFPMNDFYSSLAAGLGFGLCHTILLYGSVLANALGPGTLFSPHCTAMSTFVLAAINSCLFGLLHIGWMIIAFDGYRRRHFGRVFFVLATHIFASTITLLNLTEGGCVISIPIITAALLVTAAATFWCVTVSNYRSKRRHT